MSQVAIRAALETRLGTMSPPLATAYENKSYTPTTGTPFQRVNLLPASPDNQTLSPDYHLELGLFQVTLCYPKNAGPNDAQARAEAVKTHFARGLSLTEGALTIIITRTPVIAPAFLDDAFYCIPITIQYQCDINS